jgi:hypothetical protein
LRCIQLNIFFLSPNPAVCAQEHVDKHVVKMTLEYGQLMSTAHRVLDGKPYYGKTVNNRNILRFLLPDERENVIWKASHMNHPSGLWVRASSSHYQWLFGLWLEMLKEYTYRYGKVHKAERMKQWFQKSPMNIPNKGWLSDPPPAMPDKYKVDNSILSYRNYYKGDKSSFANWKNRNRPDWF